MKFDLQALLVPLALVGFAAPAPAQWGGGDRPGPGATMVIATKDGREVRIPLVDISGIRFEGGGPVPVANDWVGRVWEVDEAEWRGVWTRIGDSNRFKAVWRDSRGGEQRDELVLESVRGDKVVFFRESKKGRYRITLSPDRRTIAFGTADWYRSGDRLGGAIRD